jgi:hypothetical protein
MATSLELGVQRVDQVEPRLLPRTHLQQGLPAERQLRLVAFVVSGLEDERMMLSLNKR